MQNFFLGTKCKLLPLCCDRAVPTMMRLSVVISLSFMSLVCWPQVALYYTIMMMACKYRRQSRQQRSGKPDFVQIAQNAWGGHTMSL